MIEIAPKPQGSSSCQDGFIVVTAMWLLAALAALAVVASVYVAQSARALTALDAAIEWDMLSSAGVELAAYQLSTPSNVRRPTRGVFRFRLSNSNVTVEYMSEAARINLNLAPRALIAGLFAAVGASGESAAQFADRVVAWRTAPKPTGNDEETALYGAAGLNYAPRQGPFNSVDELWLVAGLPSAVVERALPFVTVYSDLAQVNVLDAAPEVIASLPDMSPAILGAFLKERESLPRDDPAFVLGAFGGKQPGATVSGSDAYRVRVRITRPDGREKMTETVIKVLGLGERGAFRVLAWRDDLDQESRTARGR